MGAKTQMPELYEITCPHCAKAYELPREKILRHAGSKIQCKTCAGVFLMPALPEIDGAAHAQAPAARQPAMAANGDARRATERDLPASTSSEQTPWPFAFTADDDEEDVRDVEVEAAHQFSPSSSDSHFADAALTERLPGAGSIDDETIDVEHESTATRPTPQPRPTAERIKAVSGKLPVDAPFQKQEIPARKPGHDDRIERSGKPASKPSKPASKPVSREVTAPPTPAPTPLSSAPSPAMNLEELAALRADVRSIARWVRFAGWLFVLTLLSAVTLAVLTYYGLIDWDAVWSFWENRPASTQSRLP